MIIGITIIAVSLMYIMLLTIVYLSKERMNNIENRIYNKLIILDMFCLFLESLCCLTVSNIINSYLLKAVVNKAFLISILTWVFLFSKYMVAVSYNNENKFSKLVKKNYKVLSILFNTFYCISCLIVIALPLHYYFDGNYIYSYGPSANYLFIATGIYLTISIVGILLNIKTIPKRKIIPIFVFLSLVLLCWIIRLINPGILLINATTAFVTVLMYFTIENPDVKMVEQTELAKEAAEKANRAKTDFLSSMSHEIRTPLNAIVGFSECINEATTLEEAKENSKDIINASQTLLEIVNGILDISKIEAGKLEIVNSPYNAQELFEELAKLITPKMNEKALDFSYYIAPDLPQTLYGDHANLKKVITNFLSNASKYTEKGFVRYEVNCINTKDICKLIITVEDSGRGIKKENIDKMFTKFQRIDEDRNTTIEGTGLGLAITKQLVELMGGKIIVHTVYGEGSKFTVVLNQRIEAVEQAEEKHKVSSTLDLNNVRILVVDDNALNIKVATKLLERYNANMITSIDNGFDCIEKIKNGEQYDVILLDDMMPKMSGVETLKKLKEIPGFHIPVVALTANAITGMREKYLADGFDNYLAKPMEKDQVIQVLNEILGRTATEEIPIDSIEEANTPQLTVEKDKKEEEAEEKDTKNEIIPVEDNIEQILKETNGNLVSLSGIKTREILKAKEEIETLEATKELPKVEEEATTLEVTSRFPKVEETKEENTVEVTNTPVIVSEPDSKNIYDRKYLELNGVDVEHGLELLGDMEMYNMTINDFAKEVESKWSKILDYKHNQDLPNYAIEVHSLKSDSKYLGFMKLADIAYEHELKSKDGDLDYVNNHFVELNNEYEKILEIVTNYVSQNKIEE